MMKEGQKQNQMDNGLALLSALTPPYTKKEDLSTAEQKQRKGLLLLQEQRTKSRFHFKDVLD
jgi:hypothetical protein